MSIRVGRCACVVVPVLVAGCKNIPVPDVPGVTPYRIEIQQGNFVSQDMVDKLRPGMSREQVRFILGTPLVTDIFHSDRWDYVYWRDVPGKPREQRRLAVYFENNRLKRVDGNVLPARKPEPPARAGDGRAAGTAASGPQAKPIPPAGASAAAKPGSETGPGAAAERKTEAAPAAARSVAASEAKDAAKQEAKPEEKPEAKKEGASERGFFGRLLEKIGF